MDRTGTTSRKDCGGSVGASKSFQERREALFQPRDFALLGNCQAICLPYDGGPADDPRHLMNFCPEVLYERFGLFATALHGYADEIDIDSAHSQLAAEHAVKRRATEARDEDYRQLHAKIGELLMENDLLYAKVDRLEASGPLARRRSTR